MILKEKIKEKNQIQILNKKQRKIDRY